MLFLLPFSNSNDAEHDKTNKTCECMNDGTPPQPNCGPCRPVVEPKHHDVDNNGNGNTGENNDSDEQDGNDSGQHDDGNGESDKDDNDKESEHVGLIVGIIVAVVVTIFVIVIICCVHKRKKACNKGGVPKKSAIAPSIYAIDASKTPTDPTAPEYQFHATDDVNMPPPYWIAAKTSSPPPSYQSAINLNEIK